MDRGYLDWPFLEPRHRARAEALTAFAAAELAPIAAAAGEADAGLDAACRSIVQRLGAAGFLDCVALEDAKATFDVRMLALSRDVLARSAALADFAFAMQGLGSGPISLFGTPTQRAAYLPPVIAGSRIAAFALSEPQAGSDVAALATSAQREGGHYVLDGTKTWISNGGLADHYVVFARTGEAPGARGLSAFVVDADNPGLRVSERLHVSAPHPLASLALEGCRVPVTALVGRPGDGFKVAMATLDVFRTTVGAAALGMARRALDEALDWVVRREAFGRPLADYQLTQARLAEMATGVDAAALLVYRSAWAKDVHGGRNTLPSSMAKLHATETAQQVVDAAVQLFGGRGVLRGVTVEALYREIRALRIYEGTSEIQKLVIARELLAQREAETSR